jgi:hypothetical protein
MAVELRTLRVSADLDASQYTVAAQQKVAADRAMSTSGKEAAAGVAAASEAIGSLPPKVSQAGNVLDRLSRQFVDGYASAQRMNAAVNALSRGIDQGKITIAQAEPILEGIYRKYGQLSDAAQFAAKGQTELAAAITATTARMQGQAAAATSAQGAVTRLNRAANGNAATLNTANIAAQFQDIAVTSAMGMSPLQIALQQGTQLQAVLGPMGAAGAARALGASLLSLVSPVSLITLGLTAAAAAAIQYFSSWYDDAQKSTAELERQNDLIRNAAQRWGDALPGIKAYNDELQRQADLNAAREAARILGAQQYDPVRARLPELSVDIVDLVQMLQHTGAEPANIIALQEAFADLRARMKDSTATGEDALRVQEALSVLLQETGVPVIRDYIGAFSGLAIAIQEANQANRRFYEDQAAIDIQRNLRPLNPLDGFNRTPFQTEEDIWRHRQTEEERRRENERLGRLVPIPTPRPNLEDEPDLYADADINRSGEQRIRQLRQEIELLGESGAAAAALRFEQEALNQAFARNIELTPEQLAGIREQAKAYGELSEALARTKLRNDLQFERAQLSRTPQEQVITSRLRGAGIGLDSPEAEYMRQTQRLEELRDGINGFFSDFRRGLMSGESIGESFASAILNAFNRQMDKALDSLFDNVASAISRAILGDAGAPAGGSVISAAFDATGDAWAGMRGAANDNYAPGAVTRSALGEISTAVGGLRYANESATRNLRLTESLEAKVREAVGAVYGPDAYASVYSGGQPALGSGLPRVGSTRHDLGHAGDLRIFAANGRQITGDGLAPLAQYWQAKGFGGTGLEMRGGGIHLDEHAGRASFWDYAGQGGRITEAQRAAVQAGQAGMFPDLVASTNQASAAIDKMATNAISATQGLDTFAGGLGQVGNSLSSAASAGGGGGGGGGGIFGWLASLFGGGGGGGGSPMISQHFPGYANGTEGAPPGWAWVGERGPELMRMRGGETIRSHAASMAMVRGPTGVHVTWGWEKDSDGNVTLAIKDVVAKEAPAIARQQAAGVVGEYNHGMSKGGSAAQQQRYNALRSGTRYG